MTTHRLCMGRTFSPFSSTWTLPDSATNSQRYDKGKFLYNVIPRPWECSKHFILHTLADLFTPKPTRLYCNYYQRLFIHINPLLPIARYSFIQLSEPNQCGMKESKHSGLAKKLRCHFTVLWIFKVAPISLKILVIFFFCHEPS